MIGEFMARGDSSVFGSGDSLGESGLLFLVGGDSLGEPILLSLVSGDSLRESVLLSLIRRKRPKTRLAERVATYQSRELEKPSGVGLLMLKRQEQLMFGEVFDREQAWEMTAGRLPHWAQAGVVTFITFRTADSIPVATLHRWEEERQAWLQAHGYPAIPWRILVPSLPRSVQREFHGHFYRTKEHTLDSCLGACPLRRPECAEIVAASLLHFDGDRYQLGDVVIMPNHVHLLAVFDSLESMRSACDSWLHFSARAINRLLQQRGNFWQREPFDHLVRSPEQYEYLRDYIAANPRKAGLREGEFWYRRRTETPE
mgnify:CR=1 FL=1